MLCIYAWGVLGGYYQIIVGFGEEQPQVLLTLQRGETFCHRSCLILWENNRKKDQLCTLHITQTWESLMAWISSCRYFPWLNFLRNCLHVSLYWNLVSAAGAGECLEFPVGKRSNDSLFLKRAQTKFKSTVGDELSCKQGECEPLCN